MSEEAKPTPPESGPEAPKSAAGGGAPPKPAVPAAGAAKPAAPPKPPAAPAVMVTAPWESDLTAALKQEFGDKILEFSTYVGQSFLIAKMEAVAPIVSFLKLEQGFDYLVDLTALHYPKKPEPFEIVYILYSFSRNERIRIKCSVKEGERPASVTGIHRTADWLEREVYDMFGVEFDGHPNLKRILMPDEWEGFPLRKDKSIIDMDQRWVQENLGIESGQ